MKWTPEKSRFQFAPGSGHRINIHSLDGKLLLTLNQMYAINCYWEIYARFDTGM